jgi:hypothetical protein
MKKVGRVKIAEEGSLTEKKGLKKVESEAMISK